MRASILAVLILLSTTIDISAAEAVRINPDNPHYFLFRGKPLVLLTASEHYGSVINRPFDFEKYLDDAHFIALPAHIWVLSHDQIEAIK